METFKQQLKTLLTDNIDADLHVISELFHFIKNCVYCFLFKVHHDDGPNKVRPLARLYINFVSITVISPILYLKAQAVKFIK